MRWGLILLVALAVPASAAKLDGVRYDEQKRGYDVYSANPGWGDYVHEIRCKTDAMTDQPMCSLRMNDLVIGHAGGRDFIHVAGRYERAPGAPTYLRIDGQPPIELPDNEPLTGPAYEATVAALSSGKLARTRYVHWPRGMAINTKLDLSVFPVAYRLFRQAVARETVTPSAGSQP